MLCKYNDDFALWHRRLGHISRENLIAVKNSSKGLENVKNITDKKCIVCVKGKQTRLPFPKSGHRASELLELIHSDVMGPLEVESYSGARYLLTFIDDYSRKIFAFPIKKKSEVFDQFLKFKNMAEKQTGKKIKMLRTDSGKEYVNNMFQNYMSQNKTRTKRSS